MKVSVVTNLATGRTFETAASEDVHHNHNRYQTHLYNRIIIRFSIAIVIIVMSALVCQTEHTIRTDFHTTIGQEREL